MFKNTASSALIMAFVAACASGGSGDTHDAAIGDTSDAHAGGSGGAGQTGAGGAGHAGTGGKATGGAGGAMSMSDAQVSDSGATCEDGGSRDGGACVAGSGCSDDCSGHGTCTTAGGCSCEKGYVGAACDVCAVGWSRSDGGTACKKEGGGLEDITIDQWGYGEASEVHALALGAADEVIFAGYTDGAIDGQTPSGMNDLVVGARYPAAQVADNWARQWGSGQVDVGHGVVVDSDGNVFVAGETDGDLDNGNAGLEDAVLSKWSADHTLQWTTQWGSAGAEAVADLARDADGNLLVAGWTTGGLQGANAGGYDVFLSKLSSSGAVTWSVQVGTASDDRAIQVAVDAIGNAYVTGPTEGKMDSDPKVGGSDIFLLKVDPSGSVKWIRQWGTSDNDLGLDVGCLQGGDLVVTGQTNSTLPGASGHGGAFVARVDTSGDVVWTQQFGPTQQDGVDRIAVGADGVLYTAGSTGSDFVPNGARGGRDVFVQALDLDGAVLWTQQFGTSGTDQVRAIAASADGTVYVAGTTSGAFSGLTKTGTFDNFLITVVP